MSSLTIVASVVRRRRGFRVAEHREQLRERVPPDAGAADQAGDFVQVGELLGTVERIGGRSTEIRTLDRVTILVPNAHLLEKEVVNWSHGDPVSRIHVPVGVEYGADLRRARAAMLEAARAHPDVLDDPRAAVELRSFGESGSRWICSSGRETRSGRTCCGAISASASWRRSPATGSRSRSRSRSAPERAGDRAGRHRVGAAAVHAEELAAAAPPAARADEPETLPEIPPIRRPKPDRLRGGGAGGTDARSGRPRDRGASPSLRDVPAVVRGAGGRRLAPDREGLTRDEALAVGNLLVRRRIVHHVLDEHGFEDGNLFYRFYADEPRIAPGGRA